MIITFDDAFEDIKNGKAVYQGYCFDDGEMFAVIEYLHNQTTNHVMDEKKVFEHIFWQLEGKSDEQAAKCSNLTENDKLYIDDNKYKFFDTI
jgi:hypothetical protein